MREGGFWKPVTKVLIILGQQRLTKQYLTNYQLFVQYYVSSMSYVSMLEGVSLKTFNQMYHLDSSHANRHL